MIIIAVMKKWGPLIIGWVIFAAGLLNISSSLWSHSRVRMRMLTQIVPLEISYASRTTTLLAGMFLLYLANGLWERKNRAWWLAVGLLIISFMSHILKGLDFAESLTMLIPLGLLSAFKEEFTVVSGRVGTLIGIRNALLILAGLFAYSTLGFYALDGQFNIPVNWRNIERDYEYSILGLGQDVLIPRTRQTVWFENSISAVGFWSILGAFGALFAPFITRTKLTAEEKEKIYKMVKNSGNQPLSYFSLMADKHYYFTKDGQGVVAYKPARGVALALGGPVNEEFSQAMREKGLIPAFYDIQKEKLEGWKMASWGEMPEIDPEIFDLSSPESADVRHAAAKISREGIMFRWYNLAAVPWQVMSEVNQLYAGWLKSKKLTPLAFSTNFFPLPTDQDAHLQAGFDASGALQSAVSLLPYDGNKRLALDLMIKAKQAPNGIMEAALADVIRFSKENYIKTVNLGMVALVGSAWAKPVIEALKPFYNYKTLYFFKRKFNPRWVKMYIGYQKETDLPRIALAAIAVHLGRGK